jgi:hypothetical protein
MTKLRTALMIGSAAALVLAGSAATHASGMEARTTDLTFRGAVALPGAEQRAGTYIFELADPNVSHDIVRVLSRDRRRVYLTAFTQSVARPANLRPNQMIAFGEVRPGEAPRIAVWYPIGNEDGHEFVYRK